MAKVLIPTNTIQRLTSLGTAQTLTIPSGSTCLMLQALSQDVFITLNGETPSATSGFRITANGIFEEPCLREGATVRVIEAAVGAEFRFQCFREELQA